MEVVGGLGPTLWITAWLFDAKLPAAKAKSESAEADPLLLRSWLWIGDFLPNRYLDLHGEMLLKETPAPEVLHALRQDIPEIVDRGGDARKSPPHCQKPDGTTSERFECVAVLGDWLRKVVPQKLQGRDLRGANLDGAVLPISDLSAVRLQGASLASAQLQGASLDKAQLQGARLNSAQLQGASLYDANFNAAVLFSVSLNGSEGLADSAVAAMVFDLNDAPLDAQQSAEIIDDVRPYLNDDKERLTDFERRVRQASQPDAGIVQFGGHDCYGSEKIGCSMVDVSERFVNGKYLPALVGLVCGVDSESFTGEAGKGVLQNFVVGEFEWDVFLYGAAFQYLPIFYLPTRLLEALNAKQCPAVESMPEDVKERLRKAAVTAEQFRLVELPRLLPDP